MATHFENTETREAALPTGRGSRVRFRLWALLLAPAMVAILLVVIFPKLLTGDFVEGTVVSIESYDSGFIIKMDAWTSSRTGWAASVDNGVFSGVGVSSESRPHWSDFISTWPKHSLITINLGLNHNKLPPKIGDPLNTLMIKQGDTFVSLPSHRMAIAIAHNVNGERSECVFMVERGSRLGF